MIMPIDIDKKEFTRDKKGYNSREVDEFLDLIAADYEKVLNDNRAMAHKIKELEVQLEGAGKADNAVVDTLETAKKLMADISASAERRAELMMRDAQLEAENLMLEAKANVRKLTDEHALLKVKVERLRANWQTMLENELAKVKNDEYNLLPDLDIEPIATEQQAPKSPTLVVAEREAAPVAENPVQMEDLFPPVSDLEHATISDLSESLKRMAEEPASLNDTIILK